MQFGAGWTMPRLAFAVGELMLFGATVTVAQESGITKRHQEWGPWSALTCLAVME